MGSGSASAAGVTAVACAEVPTFPAQPISGSAARQPQRTEAGAFHIGGSPLMVGFASENLSSISAISRCRLGKGGLIADGASAGSSSSVATAY